MNKKIIDVCCGSKKFWFNKNNPDVEYCDLRNESITLCDGRTININPNTVCDFRKLPFEDNSYYLVVFDPPHIKNIGENAYMALTYGKLYESWREDIKAGFDECMRVLKPNGTLIFKWNDHDIKVSEIIKAIGVEPLFGHKTRATKRSSTHWFAFMKMEVQIDE
jgi:ubiquinone/menaquinone biosynthesis C-methylase UbiE